MFSHGRGTTAGDRQDHGDSCLSVEYFASFSSPEPAETPASLYNGSHRALLNPDLSTYVSSQKVILP